LARKAAKSRLFYALLALTSLSAFSQTSPHVQAELALEGIVLDKSFAGLELHSRDAITMVSNTQVPGLNGILFMRWAGTDPSKEIMASVQWFENTEDLLACYRKEKARSRAGLFVVGDSIVWKTSESSYLWTDGRHFVVGLGGSPAPPRNMLEAWLTLIESNSPDLARIPATTR
jgi:hypothetical protein